MMPSKIFKETILFKLITKFKTRCLEMLTDDSLPIFLRNTDAISASPQVLGYHEIHVKKLINNFAQNGYGDFLLDIGANIGLSSCQSGNNFKEVHCYEPNPECFSILKINTRIALNKCHIKLNNFGLGVNDEETILHVPKGNWGGAFIRDKNNSYNETEIASKDGYHNFSDENYDVVSIEVRNAKNHLSDIFTDLESRNLFNGFIKIDVEGYEPVVIEAIAQSLPSNLSCAILFECFTKEFDATNLLDKFKGRASAFKLVRSPENHINKLARILKIISQQGYIYELKEFNRESNSTDLIFLVEKQ
jgi:FkbM family methyltransferase